MVKVCKLIIALMLLGCTSANEYTGRDSAGELYPHKIYVINQGWHTGIVLKVNEVNIADMPEIIEFRGNEYIDIGWGDEAYYRIPGFDIKLAARALLSPTSSTLKIRTLNIPVETYYKTYRYCIEYHLTEDEFKELCRYISNTFLKSRDRRPVVLENRQNIIYFYKAVGDYHLFNTCNTWVAGALEEAGFPVNSTMVVSASNLFNEISDYGKVLVNKY